MNLSHIFDVFSRRPNVRKVEPAKVPESTRNRVFLWCADIFSNKRNYGGYEDYTNEFWSEIHRTLQYRHGRVQLSDSRFRPQSPFEDAIKFLLSCSVPEFLDFLEYIFKVECFWRIHLQDEQAVSELNDLLRVDDLPYYLTGFVKEQTREPSPFGGDEVDGIRTREFPRVISRDNEVLHRGVTEPVLTLLRAAQFVGVNSEYLEALDDFRKGDYGDSLTKCCSAFESTMKVICERKSWQYNQTDTAGVLIKTIIEHTSLDGYFETVLLIVATLRNRLSKAHGAGVETRKVPRHLAAYALNSTGAAILMLVDEVGLS